MDNRLEGEITMGGGSHKLVETKNFIFWLPYNLHADYIVYYDIQAEIKDGSVLHGKFTTDRGLPREDGYDEGDDDEKLFDIAVDELTEQNKNGYFFHELTEEQITLSEMYRRMKQAESEITLWRNRAIEAEEVLRKLAKYREEEE